jgi:hypothetical protein
MNSPFFKCSLDVNLLQIQSCFVKANYTADFILHSVCEINFHLQGLSKQTPVVITFLQNVQQMLNVMSMITVVVGGRTLPSGDIMKLCLARWHTNKIACAFK